MATTTDSSVIMALSELARMETSRLDEERALAAARAREAAEKKVQAEAAVRAELERKHAAEAAANRLSRTTVRARAIQGQT